MRKYFVLYLHYQTNKYNIMKNLLDSIENHKLGFCISFNTDNNCYEVQKIDDPEMWVQDNKYDFIIPTLKNDDEAKRIAMTCGYIFTNTEFPYKVTGKFRTN